MKVIVDTCIWSLALRRRGIDIVPAVSALEELIKTSSVQMMGAIRQEILSGIKYDSQFAHVAEILRAFTDIPLQSEDYEHAAKFFNLCRSNGIQGSNTDFLICAAAARRGMSIFTYDNDFRHYENLLHIELYQY